MLLCLFLVFFSWPALFLPRCVCWAPSQTGLPTVLPPKRNDGKKGNGRVARIYFWSSAAGDVLEVCCAFFTTNTSSAQQTRALDTSGHTRQPHTDTDQHKTRTWKQIWGVNAVARESIGVINVLEVPYRFFFFSRVTFFFFACVWTKKIGSMFFFFFCLIIYPTPIEYVLQPCIVIVFQFGKGCHSLLLYITCFTAAVSLARQDGGTIDFQTAAHSSLQ